jgi:hypothetical protein
VIACIRGRSATGDLLHQRRVPTQRLAVERGQHQLALPHVLVLVEQEQRVLAKHRPEHTSANAAHVEHPRVAREHLADQLGIGQEHHPPVGRDVQAEYVAVAAAAALEEAVRTAEHAQRLH